jgi:hypothetical protein
MSKSMPQLQNPCRKFIDYSGDMGMFYYYDKQDKKKIEVSMPFYFEVLDELATITGFHKESESSIYSNEVSSTKTEILKVKCFGKGGINIVGLYDNIKDSVKSVGGKYTKSIYAMLINKDRSVELVNFRFHGAALNGWIEKKFNALNYVTGVKETIQKKNGANKYQEPIFEQSKIDPELDKKAIEMDVELQSYLKEYKAQQAEKETAKAEVLTIAEEHVEYDEANSGPEKGFVKEGRKTTGKTKVEASVKDEPDDLPF